MYFLCLSVLIDYILKSIHVILVSKSIKRYRNSFTSILASFTFLFTFLFSPPYSPPSFFLLLLLFSFRFWQTVRFRKTDPQRAVLTVVGWDFTSDPKQEALTGTMSNCPSHKFTRHRWTKLEPGLVQKHTFGSFLSPSPKTPVLLQRRQLHGLQVLIGTSAE